MIVTRSIRLPEALNLSPAAAFTPRYSGGISTSTPHRLPKVNLLQVGVVALAGQPHGTDQKPIFNGDRHGRHNIAAKNLVITNTKAPADAF
ncbi:hypothetical protein J6590_034140 [Homalodisca vitripennis]|nr:hypothetical protein J6590_034140 [Homalodisca vitripennis]